MCIRDSTTSSLTEEGRRIHGQNVCFYYFLYIFLVVYTVYVDGNAIMGQLYDSNCNSNNAGPRPNSPAVVLQSKVKYPPWSLYSLMIIANIC